jgi:hypothetical protein
MAVDARNSVQFRTDGNSTPRGGGGQSRLSGSGTCGDGSRTASNSGRARKYEGDYCAGDRDHIYNCQRNWHLVALLERAQMKKKKIKWDDREESERFIETAEKVGATDEKALERALKKIAPRKKDQKS